MVSCRSSDYADASCSTTTRCVTTFCRFFGFFRKRALLTTNRHPPSPRASSFAQGSGAIRRRGRLMDTNAAERFNFVTLFNSSNIRLAVSFNHFGLSPEVVRGTQAMGFVEPTPIQLRAFPIVLAGKDLIGTAQTGTGKTAAFALPILTLLAKHGGFRCLVLEPTRELAAQVETAFRDYGRFTDLRVALVHGGVGYGKQREELKRGVDILVATPGRLLDLLEQRTMSLKEVKILVLDEVDRMLDMGFLPDVRRIVEKIPRAGKLCFSQPRCRRKSNGWPHGCCATRFWWKSVYAAPRRKR